MIRSIVAPHPISFVLVLYPAQFDINAPESVRVQQLGPYMVMGPTLQGMRLTALTVHATLLQDRNRCWLLTQC